MRRAIWGIIILGLLFCGCEKKMEKIIEPNPPVDITPPITIITSPKDGAEFKGRTDYSGYRNPVNVHVYGTITDTESGIEVIKLNNIVVFRTEETDTIKIKEIYELKQYTSSGTYSIKMMAFDRAGNVGFDQVSISVYW